MNIFKNLIFENAVSFLRKTKSWCKKKSCIDFCDNFKCQAEFHLAKREVLYDER